MGAIVSKSTLHIPFLLLPLLLTIWGSVVFAEELTGVEAVTTLCETATIEPARSETLLLATPLAASRERHEYTVQRHHRLMQVYSVSLRADEFQFLPSEEGVITVDTFGPMGIFAGHHALDLGRAAALSFPVLEGQLDDIVAGYRSDQILLRLHFQLAALDNPVLSYCEAEEDGAVVIHGRLLAGELIDRGRGAVLVRAESERLRAHRIRFGVDTGVATEPRVTVISTTILDAPDIPDEVEYLTLESESVLLPCYLRALNLNGRLRGALVTQYHVDREGNVIQPTISIDAIGDSMVTGCAAAALQTIAIPRQDPEPAYGVRMTVIFSQIAPPTAPAPTGDESDGVE